MREKECTRCGKVKPLSEFHKHRLSPDGHAYQCKECNKTRARAWTKTPSGIYSTICGQAKFYNKGEVELSREEFVEWYENEPKMCHYCGISEADLHKFGDTFNNQNRRLEIDRKDNNISYNEGNIVLACKRCNATKNNFFTYEDMLIIGRNHVAPKWAHIASEFRVGDKA